MNGMNEAILAVAQAQQQGDAIPVDVPPMTQAAFHSPNRRNRRNRRPQAWTPMRSRACGRRSA